MGVNIKNYTNFRKDVLAMTMTAEELPACKKILDQPYLPENSIMEE
ncbi:hypothetical protein ACO22_02677 [Paracoccidioides brasiliensis]|uniref:Uncharacterized protein n=1 Tax=Paracoccidioides brasiliensis TaxID=121759 RepID=A0A1D2JI30_PARBR|nr:hypothetical protein ACO22_02677 [Paracoccidioides brasiliensis]